MVSPVTASGFDVVRLAETDSTNDVAIALAREGAPDRTVVVADFQRRGRGRLDRRWEAPAGTALLCSVLLRVELAASERHLCTVAVGLAATDACRTVWDLDAGLKWPNDLVVSDRKLGGVLAETDGRVEVDGTVAIVVGLGVNVRWPGPPEAGGTSILECAVRDVEPEDVLSAYLEALDAHDVALRSANGRAELARAYRARLVTIGRRVRIQLAEESVVGTAQDVTDDGQLVVATDKGPRTIASGDAVHLRPASEGSSEARE